MHWQYGAISRLQCTCTDSTEPFHDYSVHVLTVRSHFTISVHVLTVVQSHFTITVYWQYGAISRLQCTCTDCCTEPFHDYSVLTVRSHFTITVYMYGQYGQSMKRSSKLLSQWDSRWLFRLTENSNLSNSQRPQPNYSLFRLGKPWKWQLILPDFERLQESRKINLLQD